MLFLVGVIDLLLLLRRSSRLGLLASPSLAYVGLNHLLWLRWLPLRLLGRPPLALVNLCELGHQRIQRGLSETLIVL